MFFDLKFDWRSKLNGDNFIEREIVRAQQLGVPYAECIQEDINNRMTKGLDECWDLVVKYMEKPFQTPPFSITLVLVNELSAHWAAGLLEGL